MTEREPVVLDQAEAQNEDGVEWPLSYRLKLPQQQPIPGATTPKPWWSHSLYQGPEGQPVEILYSKTKAKSEAIAKQFLNEPVVGFDMEWPWDSHKLHRLQDKIGLIQIACEDKIALFHIGLHPGKKMEDLIAPSLKKIIESPNIAKAGVAVLNADFARLSRFFGLKPQAAFELSHLHRLVTYGGRKPEILTTKLVKLAHLVEDHLGLPLSKGKVRTSNWSKALNPSQIRYAAGDAYAGFMLFHCMNTKRAAMNPTPPLPLLADKYLSSEFGPITLLRLHPTKEGGEYIIAKDFFEVKNIDTADTERDPTECEGLATKDKSETPTTKPKQVEESLDAISQAMFDQLSQRRKVIAATYNLPAYRIASNSVLAGLARQRPVDEVGLLLVKGVGKVQQEKYGAEWLEVIQLFVALNNIQPHVAAQAIENKGTSAEPPQKPTHLRRETRSGKKQDHSQENGSSSSSPTFGTPLLQNPQLSTGLSFTLAEIDLVDSQESTQTLEEPSASNNLSTFGKPLPKLCRQLKRKRSRSPIRRRRSSPLPEPKLPLTPESKIFRNKLEAYSKLVGSKLGTRPLKPLVSAATLDLIITSPPRTKEELNRIPGITALVEACSQAKLDLLKNITKFAPARY